MLQRQLCQPDQNVLRLAFPETRADERNHRLMRGLHINLQRPIPDAVQAHGTRGFDHQQTFHSACLLNNERKSHSESLGASTIEYGTVLRFI